MEQIERREAVQTAKAERLSSAQRFLLREMAANVHGVVHLQGHYARTRHALQHKGLVAFNAERGMYEVTAAGRDALGVTC